MLVKHVWESLNHSDISKTGYQQTGPELPLYGPIEMSDIARDLRDLVREMCPHLDPTHVGTQIRQEAYDVVETLWNAGIVTSWKNYRLVVEDHADHRACGEGEEAMPWVSIIVIIVNIIVLVLWLELSRSVFSCSALALRLHNEHEDCTFRVGRRRQ